MKTIEAWSDFHDAAIIKVSISLPDQFATIEIDTHEGLFLIVGEGTTLLSCSQSRPWGQSRDVFINEAKHTRPNGERLELETQNGDSIVLEAARIYFERNEATARK